jgi:CheY-like chemotaxis protein
MTKQVTVLLVDDDEIDREVVKRAFRAHQIASPIVMAEDGERALAILRSAESDGGIRRPFLVLLDLNMPRMGGLEFLDHLRKDEVLHDSIVFILTTSEAERDKQAAYQRHAAGYLCKSNLGRGFSDLAEVVQHYTRAVEFPPERRVPSSSGDPRGSAT